MHAAVQFVERAGVRCLNLDEVYTVTTFRPPVHKERHHTFGATELQRVKYYQYAQLPAHPGIHRNYTPGPAAGDLVQHLQPPDMLRGSV